MCFWSVDLCSFLVAISTCFMYFCQHSHCIPVYLCIWSYVYLHFSLFICTFCAFVHLCVWPSVFPTMVFHFTFVIYFYSPIGEVFRARLRQFPALVNCCTIDWFSPWPQEALQSVAWRFLGDLVDLDEDSVSGIVSSLPYLVVAACE